MSNRTSIAWTDVTDNIIIVEGGGWWCRMTSPGCAHCYAAALNQSAFFGGNKLPYNGEPPRLKLRTDIIDGWERQKHPKRHFVASMTDVFGEWVTFQMVVTFMRGMWRAPKQTFQVLTKRPAHMARMIGEWLKWDGLSAVPDNIWIGVSVEDQQRADERIPILLSIPAATRWVSYEPALGAVHFGRYFTHSIRCEKLPGPGMNGGEPCRCNRIDWVVVGGESGRNARECSIDWIDDVLWQCKGAGVPVFIKQMGAFSTASNVNRWDWPDHVGFDSSCCAEGAAAACLRYKHPKGGDPSEWPAEFRVREFPV